MPRFVGHQPAARSLSRCCLCKKSMSTPRYAVLRTNSCSQSDLCHHVGQHIDLVACYSNGKAWQCSNRDNISTIDEAFADWFCQRHRALLHSGCPVRFQTTGLTFVGSSNRPIQIGIGRYACMVRSPSHAKTLGLRSTDQSCHHETWLPPGFRRLAQLRITSRRT